MSRKKPESKISILTANFDEAGNVSQMFPSLSKAFSIKEVSLEKFSENVAHFIRTLCDTLERIPEHGGDYDVDELTFSLGLDGSGRVFLIGELSAGINSAITIKIKKKKGSNQ